MATKVRKSTPLPILGLDVSKPGEWIDPRATSRCENVEIRRSVIVKRPGTIELGDSLGERIQALFDYDDGQATHFVRIGNTEAEAYSQVTDSWTSILAAPLTGSASDRISYAFPLLSGARIAVFTNGLDAIMKWTGSGNAGALGGSPPLAKFLIDFGSYLVLAYITTGGSTFRSRVQWSDTGNIEQWGSGDAGSTNLLEDTDDITGLGRFGNYLTVHKKNSIYVGYLTGTSAIFRFDRRATGAGTASHSSIQSLPTGEQIFLSSDGIRIFNGVTAPLIDSPIMDELREFMNPSNIVKATSLVVKELDEYWVGIAIGSSTEPDTIYKYNYLSHQVYKDTRPLLVAMGDYRSTTSAAWNDDPDSWDSDTTRWDQITDLSLSAIQAFGFSDGTVTKRTTGASDDGEAIEGLWVSKGFKSSDFGLPDGILMRWTGIQFLAKGQSVTIDYSTVGAEGPWINVGTFTLTSDYPTQLDDFVGYLDAVSELCFFRFSNTNDDETFTLKQFYPEASARETR